MNSVICTLFEGEYHHGVITLINSLYKHNFRGSIYAGYRGQLPFWAKSASLNPSIGWKGARIFKITDEIEINFLPIENSFHLTNYKPYFILNVLELNADQITSIFYFDPDIVVKCNWAYFEKWVSLGVSLIHEISEHDMPPSHPLRLMWNEVIQKANKSITRNLYSYINAGFVGISRNNAEFIRTWVTITETAIQYFGLSPNQWDHNYDRTYIFYKQDQDALNITAMCSDSPISEMGPEAMDFIPGGFTMSHCVGSPKPWAKNFILSSLQGVPPSLADKAYWENSNIILSSHSLFKIKRKKLEINISSFISRFYIRN